MGSEKINEQNFKYIEDTEKEEKPISNFFIKFLSLVIILLLIIYFFTNSALRGIIIGLIDSSILNKNVVLIKGVDYADRLIFLNNSYDILMKIYDENLGKEFKVCLIGKIKGRDYMVYAIHKPKMFFQSSSSVVSEACPSYAIVSMHTHPEKHCLPSEADMNSFEVFKQRNTKGIMAIMCERGRFNFYEK
jgi:proteasome lid subunit RPN8/RPN11